MYYCNLIFKINIYFILKKIINKKMSIRNYFLILLLFGICINQDYPKFIDSLTCGKSSPKKETDCTKYGTGSGLLCCWIADNKDSESGKCYLLSEAQAEKYGIDGEKLFNSTEMPNTDHTNYYWSCGNMSTFININVIMLIFVLFSL